MLDRKHRTLSNEKLIVYTVISAGFIVLLATAIVLLTTLNPESGILSIATNPTRATVTIDGKIIGQTPITVQVPTGTHHVVISKDGYRTLERAIFTDPSAPEASYDFLLETALHTITHADKTEQIEKLKRLAEDAFKRGDYVAPENDNALYYINQLQQLVPDEPFVTQLRERIRQALRQQAETTRRRSNLS
jgi:hypothetical protein